MDKKAIKQMKGAIKSVKKAPQFFGFSPNQGEPVLLVKKTAPVKKAAFVSAVEGEIGVPVKGKSIYIGRVTKVEDTWHFAVSPDSSQGQISEAKARKAMIKLGQLLGVGALKKAVFSFGDIDAQQIVAKIEQQGSGPAFVPIDPAALHAVLDLLALPLPIAPQTRNQLRALRAPLKELRDALKLNLSSYQELSRSKRKPHAASAAIWQDLLDQVNAAGQQARAAVARGVDTQPQADKTRLLALPIGSRAVSAFSKRAGKQLARYEAWAARSQDGTLDPDEHREQLLALKEAILQSRRDSSRRSKSDKLDALLKTVEDKLTEVDIQEQLDKGYLTTTGDGDASGGASGSYFLGTEEQGRTQVFKPMYQEMRFPSGLQRSAGDGLRGELLGSLAAQVVKAQTALDLGVPSARMVTLENPRFGEVGTTLQQNDELAGDLFDDRAADVRQPGALIDGVSGVQGSLEDLMIIRHPDYPNITAAKTASDEEIVQILARDYPNWAQLEQNQKRVAFERLVKASPELLAPPNTSDAVMRKQLGKAAISCIVTGQLDHQNPDNILFTGQGDDVELRPIDFGVSNPSISDFKRRFDFTGSDMGTNPWGASCCNRWADDPIDGEVAAALKEIDEEALVEAMRAEGERLQAATGGQCTPLTEEQLQLQRYMIKASKLALAEAARKNVDLTLRSLSELFYSNHVNDAPFVAYTKHMMDNSKPPNTSLRQDPAFFAQHFEGVFVPALNTWLDNLG